ncbi:MAG: sulfatase-like hydrolase/transferase [Acidobacteriota bacterium]
MAQEGHGSGLRALGRASRRLGAALAAALLSAFSAAAEGPPRAPSVLLVTLDTTRADRLGCYGRTSAKTPVLDALAARGALFEKALSHVPLTLPSHAVLLTGKLPSSLNLRVNGLTLREGVPSLATRLKAKGYWTGAVVSSVVLDRARGLAAGFDVYDDRMTLGPRSGGPPEERRAEEVTRAALEAVRKAKGPFFLWAHYYDPHYEYRPPEPYAKAFAKDRYDGEIAYMDAQVGALLEGLGASGLLENTLVVVAGDHGEGLMEHGERQHGVFLYDYALRVPLLVAWEGRIRGGRRIPDLCGLCDVAPTVLDLLGLTAGEADGRSLRPLLEGKALPARPVYAESYHGFFTYGWAPLRGLVDGPWKFIEAPRPELYEWEASETKNLLAARPVPAAALRKALSAYPAADSGEKAEMDRLLKDPSNAETLRQLMSLGYLSAGGVRPDAQGLLDPKDVIGIEEELRAVTDLMDQGEKARGVEALLSILKRNPENVPALSMLGIAYLNDGQLDKARVCFEREVLLKPQMDTAHLNLGTVHKRKGNLDLAEKEYRAALALSPGFAEAAANLAEILLQRDRLPEARGVLEEALGRGSHSADLYFEKGLLEARESKWEAARYAFTKAVSLDPLRHQALANLGRIAYQQGRVDEAVVQYERALKAAPREASYMATLGSLYLSGKEDPAAALAYFRKALAADPYGPEAGNLRDIIRGLESNASLGE